MSMVSRREFLGITAGAGATLALTPQLLRALQTLQQPGGTLLQRAIPSTGEKLPVIGLSFSNHVSCADPAALREVFKTFVDNGGKLFDAMHGNAASEQFHATLANELGVQNKLFWSTRATAPPGPNGPAPLGPDAVKDHVETLLARLKVPRLDLVMASSQHLPAVKEEKKARRIRYIGSGTISSRPNAARIEEVMRTEPIDFIGVDYDVSNRHVEDTILPLAQERKIGVMAYFPLGNNGGVSCGSLNRNLFARVGSTPLPAWAAEFDAKTWAQFFLKYVISHPAVTVARVGTTKPHHMLDNIGGGIGRLPNEATRKRMAAFIDALPPLPPLPPPPQGAAQAPGIALSAAIIERYVGEWKLASGGLMTFRRDGATLFVKPGNAPEAPLNARSETRFQDPRGPIFEFQVDAGGAVTGLVLEQGNQRVALTRVR